MSSRPVKKNLINLYFYTSYVILLLGQLINMSTSSAYEAFSKISLLNIYGYIHQYASILYMPLFSPIMRAFPSQLYGTGPVIPEFIFNLIIFALIISYIFFLENLRKIIITVFTGKMKNGNVRKRLNIMCYILLGIFFVSFITEVVQGAMIEGFTKNIFMYAITPEIFSPIVFLILIWVISGSLKNQIKLQKEVESII